MPIGYRTVDGKEHRPGPPLSLTLANGTRIDAQWAGSAQEEKLEWWLRPPGVDLAQTDEVSAIAVRDGDTDEVRWGETPAGTRVFFVVQAPVVGKNGETYRLAKMVTAAATAAQEAYFNENRFALLGTFKPDGSIGRIAPLEPPPPAAPKQGELF